MTPADLAAIEAIEGRLEAAPKGPWCWKRSYELHDGKHWALHCEGVDDRVLDPMAVLWHRWTTLCGSHELPNAYMKFAAHSWQDITDLLGIVRQQAARLAELEGAQIESEGEVV